MSFDDPNDHDHDPDLAPDHPTGPARSQPAPPAPLADGQISRLVVFRGAATGLLIAMPAAFVNVVVSDQKPKPQAAINLSFLAVLIGFILAGWLAGREAPSVPSKHGAAAAFVAFIPIEVIGILGRLDRGEALSLGSIIFVGLLAACAGTAGAQLGAARRARKESP
ncbi:hypothetical protein [Aquihabitans sp. McL0605]|uniref:hypothetical protein n=1 Tax=Aquihabitans sp. McL0605 TaxID=3415671 RepID=UPI003CF83F5F